ncbi:MAG: helix-turn-helix domain-containing protein [Gammaproteobacteria bacterium]|nr:helix-turn-helix domain-containing protein [Gammaproteobacteria bacterium]MDH5735147.1 helix-turn-helix domain-containing protein [Gammaproteobacteria bacterium]
MINSNEQNNADVECICCDLYNLCQLAGLGDADTQRLDSTLKRRQQIPKDHVLFDAGEKFRGIFAVKSGALKTTRELSNNSEQIIDFHIPGELVGMDAIDSPAYLHRVIASENSSICEMDLEAMKKMNGKYNDFQSSLIQALTRKVRLDQYQALLISTKTAEQRLAVFLTALSSRFQLHGLPANQFRLPVSRKNIANYLGMAAETVARTFKTFEKKGLIVNNNRNITLIKPEELITLASLN